MVWIMIHSGSRNIGKQVADYYNKIAKNLNNLWHSSVDPKADLAFLPFKTDEARKYYNEMKYCVDFAFANRKLMLTRVQEVLVDFFPKISFGEIINIAHNYAAWENHFGQDVVVHRKGATSANKGEIELSPARKAQILILEDWEILRVLQVVRMGQGVKWDVTKRFAH